MSSEKPSLCVCGSEPDVMVNSYGEVFVACRYCGRKGETIEPDIGSRVSVENFFGYLEEAGKKAVKAWNEQVGKEVIQ